jgi:MFS family permease
MFRPSALRDLIHHPLFPGIYLPALLFSIAQMMIVPVLPVYAREEFAVSYGLIGVVLAAGQIGRMLGDIPAGLFLRRWGRKPAMLSGLSGAAISGAALFAAGSIPEVIAWLLLFGISGALYNISLHDYLSGEVVNTNRGRSIAMIGGVYRAGRLIGPTIATTLAALFGLRVPFLVVGGFALIAGTVVLRNLPAGKKPKREHIPSHSSRLLSVMRRHKRDLAVTGMGQVCAQITRAGSHAIIPLYGTDVLGLSVEMIGPIFSVSAALDLIFFYPAGWVMDTKGRKYAIVPSFVIQAIGLALIPLTMGFWGLLGAASLIGLGNGLSAGTMMTLGADLAPPDSRGEFLGVWRLIGDMGSAGGPLIVGGIAGILALGASALVISGAGGMAASIFAFLVPETLQKS